MVEIGLIPLRTGRGLAQQHGWPGSHTVCLPPTLLQANDRHVESSGQSEVFRKYPRKASILNMPLVTTLFYSCFYHYTEAEVGATVGVVKGSGT